VHYKLYWLGENCETPEENCETPELVKWKNWYRSYALTWHIELTEDYKSNLKNWVENRSRNRHGQKGYKHEVVDIKDMNN
jgi:hypothetical protein